jgi:hypothetical protein
MRWGMHGIISAWLIRNSGLDPARVDPGAGESDGQSWDTVVTVIVLK